MTVWEGPANIQALEVMRMIGNRLPGFEAFERRIEEILESLPQDLGGLADPLSGALEECRQEVALVRTNGAAAERHAHRLMKLMADTLAAALLADEAGYGHRLGDARKSILAATYIAKHFTPPPRRGIVADEDPVHRHFEALVGYEPVEAVAKPPRRAAN